MRTSPLTAGVMTATGNIARRDPRTGAIEDQQLWNAYAALGAAGTILGAYHGYKRNNSVGWAIGWALLGGAFPFITIPVSLAQGFGKRA